MSLVEIFLVALGVSAYQALKIDFTFDMFQAGIPLLSWILGA